MEKSTYRGYILIRYQLGKTIQEIFDELVSSSGEAAPSYATVWRWFTRFSEGTEDLEDKNHPGRPITATTEANIQLVRAAIENDPHISYNQIEAETSLNHWVINKIIHDHLELRKVTSRWVPYDLKDAQKAQRVQICRANLEKFNTGKWRLCDIITGDESWIYHRQIRHKQANASWVAKGEQPRTVVRRNQYEAKTMICIFFKSTGPVLIDCLQKGTTMDSKYYVEYCLKPSLLEVNRQRPNAGAKSVKILHDNARPHVAKTVKTYLESEKITVIDHPPYSPDLAPCDFWLFDKIKQSLSDHKSAESLKIEITEILEAIPKEEYQKTFKKYLERLQLCIDNHGDYFEHLIK